MGMYYYHILYTENPPWTDKFNTAAIVEAENEAVRKEELLNSFCGGNENSIIPPA